MAQINTAKIGIQLYSVKDDAKSNLDGTLEQLAAMGFDGVEFAGEFGAYLEDPRGLRAKLDGLGLAAPSAHIRFEQLDEEHFDKTVTFYKTLGVTYLINPYQAEASNPDKIDWFVKQLNQLAIKLAPHGMRTGYHNHYMEFAPYKDVTFWDYLATNTSDEVVLEHDLGWIKQAGKEPLDYVKSYPGRTELAHYKIVPPKPNPKAYSPILGEDNYIDWLELSKVCLATGGIKWMIVEQETYPEGLSPLESVARSKAGLDQLLATSNC